MTMKRVQYYIMVHSKVHLMIAQKLIHTIIPDTVSNSSLGKILNWRGNNNDRVSTTCPESFYDAKVDSNYNQASQIKGLSFFGINYSITDDNNGQHFITIKNKKIAI